MISNMNKTDMRQCDS